ncbi:hypothetical protein [Clostridium tyrobutyricum]|uniref:hypothetical protein n=1 Tax=Clostridium tyrobutyricum TaxID=1519 RepID=UPI001C382D91|nr:hypothetical protein [Clostridium tyrobutyricum]MBV4423448.1 hypothetical protein [Clostridium tyrobutyricum]
MAEYTLGQMIEKLGRNPNLKFKYTAEESCRTDKGVVITLDEFGRIINEKKEPILSYFTLNSKFSLVNEPVDRMTAFKAFEKGKSIYCDYEGKKYHYNRPSVYGNKLIDNLGDSISIEEILYGKWFIEEEEK